MQRWSPCSQTPGNDGPQIQAVKDERIRSDRSSRRLDVAKLCWASGHVHFGTAYLAGVKGNSCTDLVDILCPSLTW